MCEMFIDLIVARLTYEPVPIQLLQTLGNHHIMQFYNIILKKFYKIRIKSGRKISIFLKSFNNII